MTYIEHVDLPPLTSEDNHFINDILSLVSAGSYIARTAIQDPKGAQLMDSCVLAMGVDALRSRFLALGIDEPDAKVIAGEKFMEKVDPQLKTGVSSKAVLDQLREAMEEAGANFELPPEPKPTQALQQLLEALRDSLQGKKS